eukprot:4292190-Prorocentrum_lima.AAC.1
MLTYDAEKIATRRRRIARERERETRNDKPIPADFWKRRRHKQWQARVKDKPEMAQRVAKKL